MPTTDLFYFRLSPRKHRVDKISSYAYGTLVVHTSQAKCRLVSRILGSRLNVSEV